MTTKTLYHYTPISPLQSEYRDDGSTTLLSIPYLLKDGREWSISLLGSAQEVYLIRVAIPGLTDEKVQSDDRQRMTEITEHMLSVLRLTYDPECDFFRTGDGYLKVWNFIDADLPPNLHLKMDHGTNPEYRINSQNVGAVFCGSIKIRNVLRLVSDSQVPSIPLQYRYLSLYKVLELEFKNGREWRRDRIDSLFNEFIGEYEALTISQMSLFNFVISVRDKCAHIRIGNNDRPGIVGLDSPDATVVERFMPLLRKIVKRHLSQAHADLGLQFPDQSQSPHPPASGTA